MVLGESWSKIHNNKIFDYKKLLKERSMYLPDHTTIVQTQVDFHRQVQTGSWILMRHIWHDMTSFSLWLYVSCLTILYTYISNKNSVVFYWGLLKAVETPHLHCFSLISLRKFNVNTSNCNKQHDPRSSWLKYII